MVRSILGAVALAALVSMAACSPPAEKASPPPTTTAETPAPTPPPAAPVGEVMQLAITDASGAQLSGDTERGRRIFAQCATCHSPDQGVNRVGPSLHAIVGRRAGSIPGFRYSDANRNSGITWTEQEMFTYLENPRARIPGTIMAFVGLRNPQQRADVIAYLKHNAATNP
ncbi:MAG: cytochrome c family protein [Phycisphaerales bacterium]|nr:cytochrome c family protein [Hyphomonadaceae bacterium]